MIQALRVVVPAPEEPFAELRAGHLGVRVARHADEIDAAKALRYRVFYEEMGAQASEEARALGRDQDRYDEVADHLLVIDHARGAGAEGVVGTYRLIRPEAAERIGQFYSADEYDLAPLLRHGGRLLELGRSCVELPYRTGGVMQLLWRGIAAYVFHHNIDTMFGCASFPGIDQARWAEVLTWLYQNHLAPPALRPRALAERFVEMNTLPAESLETRKILADVPPLIKGYLRLGGFVGDGAVIDRQFNTTDIAIVVKTDLVTEKYHRHYLRTKNDGAAGVA